MTNFLGHEKCKAMLVRTTKKNLAPGDGVIVRDKREPSTVHQLISLYCYVAVLFQKCVVFLRKILIYGSLLQQVAHYVSLGGGVAYRPQHVSSGRVIMAAQKNSQRRGHMSLKLFESSDKLGEFSADAFFNNSRRIVAIGHIAKRIG